MSKNLMNDYLICAKEAEEEFLDRIKEGGDHRDAVAMFNKVLDDVINDSLIEVDYVMDEYDETVVESIIEMCETFKAMIEKYDLNRFPLIYFSETFLALNLIDRAQALDEQLLAYYRKGQDPLGHASVCDDLANIYQRLNRNSEVEPMLRESLVMYWHSSGNNMYKFISMAESVCIRLAIWYVKAGDMEKYPVAELLLKDVLEFKFQANKKCPDAAKRSAVVYNKYLEKIYMRMGRYVEAEALYKQDIETYKCLCEKNPEIYSNRLANAYKHLSTLYTVTNRSSQAEKLFKMFLDVTGEPYA